jgi:hypothetical protein
VSNASRLIRTIVVLINFDISDIVSTECPYMASNEPANRKHEEDKGSGTAGAQYWCQRRRSWW